MGQSRATLQTHRSKQLFVVGDAAELPDPVTKQATIAMDMGRVAARNIEALARDVLRPSLPPRQTDGDLVSATWTPGW